MNTNLSRLRPLRLGGLAFVALALAGCLQDRLAWSPDGQRLAIVTAEGLHLADASGRVSPLLAHGVYRAAWLPDSQRVALARRREAKTFAEVAAALGPDRTRTLVAKAETVWRQLKDLPRSDGFDQRLAQDVGDDLGGILAYLREQPQHLAALREKFGADWKKEDETKPIDLHEVVLARVVGQALEPGPTLVVGLPPIRSLRPAPGGSALAFTRQTELSLQRDNGICVWVVPVDGSAPPALAATQSSTQPDWSSDGRSLVFFKTSGGAGDDLRLGTLTSREVLNPAGRLRLAEETADLAGLIFHQQSRVRCLRNGRVIFNATPFQLPTLGAGEKDREQLFAIDPARKTSVDSLVPTHELARLPKALSAFEVSPDDRQVLFGSENGEVWRLTLATGQVEAIAPAIESDKDRGEGENFPAPVWRAAGEPTFLRKVPIGSHPAGASPFQLVLRRGETESILSQTWDAALLRRLIE